MKKLLALFGSISLIALSSTSVISCVIKNPSKPTFTNIYSLDKNAWNQADIEFRSDEVVADNAEHEIKENDFVYRTIAAQFKNPEAVEKYFQANPGNIVYKASLPDKSDPKKNISYLRIYLKDRPTAGVGGLKVGLSADKTRLAVDETAAIAIDLNYQQSTQIYNALIDFYQNYISLKKEKNTPPEKLFHDAAYGLDSKIKNSAINALSEKYLPGYDETNKIMFASIGEQFKYLKKGYHEMNAAIFAIYDQINNDGGTVYKPLIEEKIKDLNLSNVKMTLTTEKTTN